LGKGTNHVLRIYEFENLRGPSVQNLKVDGLLGIVWNMWKVFTRTTNASDFL
jgi:hypothetical protein